MSSESASRSDPAFKLAPDHAHEHGDAVIAVVEAGDVAELLAAVIEEDLLVLHGDFAERLDAIGGEAGRDDGDPLHSVARQRLYCLVGVRLEPLGASEARLEGELELGAKFGP